MILNPERLLLGPALYKEHSGGSGRERRKVVVESRQEGLRDMEEGLKGWQSE